MRPGNVLRFFRRNQDTGAAAVEFALLAPMLIGMFVPLVDLGLASYQQMEVQDAAEAGAQYALFSGYSASGIESAAQNATSLGANVSVTPSEGCYCVSGSSLVTETCGTDCSDHTTAGTYVAVSTSVSYSTLISYPIVPSSFTLTGTSFVRIN